jgi:ATP-dependent DNA helicase RecG
MFRETRNLEFKKDITNTFLKTVSAFANYEGGRIIFGVDDGGKAVGLPDPRQACLDIENKINDSVSPQPEYTLSINDEDRTVTLDVKRGTHTPYLYKSKAYKRGDSATIEVDTTELKRLILLGEHLRFEELRADKQDLDFSVLDRKLQDEVGVSVSEPILKTLNLYSDDVGYNNAAELLADENLFPGIDAARFGDSISIILQRKTTGNRSVLTILQQAVEMYRDAYQYEKIEGILREKVELIPEDAFREVIANALMHRTWDVPQPIRMYFFPDRAEIVSPGGLPEDITEEQYLRGQYSSLRNPILSNVFFRLHLVEILGTGILRIKEAYAGKPVQPSFEITDNAIKVTLPVARSAAALSAEEQSLYDMLPANENISMTQILESTSLSRYKVGKLLHQLEDKGYIRIQGGGRNTRYRKVLLAKDESGN